MEVDFIDIEMQQRWMKELQELECEPFFFCDTKGQSYMHELPKEYQQYFVEKNIGMLQENYFKIHKEVLRLKNQLRTFTADVFSSQEDVFFNNYSREFHYYDGDKKIPIENHSKAMEMYIRMRLYELTLLHAIHELEDNP